MLSAGKKQYHIFGKQVLFLFLLSSELQLTEKKNLVIE